MIDGFALEVLIKPMGAKRCTKRGDANPVPVTLTIGDDSGTVSVKASIH